MTRRLIKVIVISVLAFPVGYVVSQYIWGAFHGPHDTTETGLFSRGVIAHLGYHDDRFDRPFPWLHFCAHSPLRWYWTWPKTVGYSTVDVEWGDPEETRHATIRLPDLTYESEGGSGEFTREVLAGWLLGENTQVPERQHSDDIFEYFEAAATGALPNRRMEEPMRIHIQHIRTGLPFSGGALVWLGAWVVWVVRRIARETGESCESACAQASSHDESK